MNNLEAIEKIGIENEDLLKYFKDYEVIEYRKECKSMFECFYIIKMKKIKNKLSKYFLPEIKNREEAVLRISNKNFGSICYKFGGLMSSFPQPAFKNKYISQAYIMDKPIFDSTVEKIIKCKNDINEIDNFLENGYYELGKINYVKRLEFMRTAMGLAEYEEAYKYVNAKFLLYKMENSNI